MGRRKLVDSQTVLATIQRWVVQTGMPPTIDELRQALGVGSTRTILRYLEGLEEAGDIRRWDGARGIRLLRAPKRGVETVQVPLVGEAPAGPAMLAEQNLEGWLRVPTTMAKPGPARFFLLRVRGDSMNRAKVEGEKIEDGDLVLVRQQPTARTGEIVVALLDGQATIKKLVKGKGYYVLQPASRNARHQPILVDRDFLIQGVVCRVFKRGSEFLSGQWGAFTEEE